jgi:hypothetical protein
MSLKKLTFFCMEKFWFCRINFWGTSFAINLESKNFKNSNKKSPLLLNSPLNINKCYLMPESPYIQLSILNKIPLNHFTHFNLPTISIIIRFSCYKLSTWEYFNKKFLLFCMMLLFHKSERNLFLHNAFSFMYVRLG